jgi:hypothetical protein
MARTKAAKAIVLSPHHDGHENVLFLMAVDDFRYGTANYRPVTQGRLTAERVRAANGIPCRVYAGDDGARYLVFPDWSARREGKGVADAR